MEIKEFKIDTLGMYKVTFTDMTNIPTWNGDTAMAMTLYVKGKKYYTPIASFSMTWRILMKDIRPWLIKNCKNNYSILILDDIMMTVEIEDGSLIFSTIPQKGSLESSRTVIPNSVNKFKSTLTNLFYDDRIIRKLGRVEHQLKSDSAIINQEPVYLGKFKNRNDVVKYFAPISPQRLRQLSEEKSTLHMVIGKIVNSINNEMKFNNVKFLFAYKGNKDMFILFVMNNSDDDTDGVHYHFIDMDNSAIIGSTFDAGEAYDRTQLAFLLDSIKDITSREYYHDLCKFLQE